MATYLVTGGAGFIGSNLVKALVADGHTVRVVDDFSAGKKTERTVAGVEYIEGNIAEAGEWQKAFSGTQGVFHLAAQPRVVYSVERPLETHAVNVTGTLNVLIAARDAQVKRLIFSSSAAVYGDQTDDLLIEDMTPNPVSPYGAHKQMGEEYCRLFSNVYGLATVSLRYFNVYGPGFDPDGAYALVVGKFLKKRSLGDALPICGDGEYYRDYVHVSDIVSANRAAMEATGVGKGEVINIGSGIATSTNQLADLIGGKRESVPDRPGDPRISQASIAKAAKLLGWKPSITLAEGIMSLKKELGIAE